MNSYSFASSVLKLCTYTSPPGWLSGERVGLMTWWFKFDTRLRQTLFGEFSPLTSAETCEKSNRWLWKESCVSAGVRKPGNTWVCVTDRHDMTLTVTAALKPNTCKQIGHTWIIYLRFAKRNFKVSTPPGWGITSPWIKKFVSTKTNWKRVKVFLTETIPGFEHTKQAIWKPRKLLLEFNIALSLSLSLSLGTVQLFTTQSRILEKKKPFQNIIRKAEKNC